MRQSRIQKAIRYVNTHHYILPKAKYKKRTKHKRQCTYNVTLRRCRATIVAVEKLCVLLNINVCICSLRYLACNAHAPYCHLLAAALQMFPHYIINNRIFEKKKLLNTKCLF